MALGGGLAFGKPQYGVAVAPGEDPLGRLAPRQPQGGDMLAWGERHGQLPGNPQAEHMLGIEGHSRGETVPPYRIDFPDVAQVPLGELVARGVDAGFLAHLADRGLPQRLALVLAARDRLPVSGVIGSLEQQHLEGGVEHHDQRGDRDLVRAQTRARAVTGPVPSNQAWGMSRVRCRATACPCRSTAMMPTSASKARPISSSTARMASSNGSPRAMRSETARVESRRITYSPVPVADAATCSEA